MDARVDDFLALWSDQPNVEWTKKIRPRYIKWSERQEERVPLTELIYHSALNTTQNLEEPNLDDLLGFLEEEKLDNPFADIFTCAWISKLLPNKDDRLEQLGFYGGTRLARFLEKGELIIEETEWILNGLSFEHHENLKNAKKGNVRIRSLASTYSNDSSGSLFRLNGAHVTVECNVALDLCQSMSNGKLIIDGKYVQGQAAGSILQGGKLHIKGDCSLQNIGSHMEGGTIQIDGNIGSPQKPVSSLQIGTSMKDGTIIIEGSCYIKDGELSIGSGMKNGAIKIKGNVVYSKEKDGKPPTIGMWMKRGHIEIGESIKSDFCLDIGSHMKDPGGEIRIGEDVISTEILRVGIGLPKQGKITVGRNCLKGFIGSHLNGGEIDIKGNAGYQIGHVASDGKISIGGDVDQYCNEGWCHSIGSLMKGGSIYIKGNAHDFSGERDGGAIYHKGKLQTLPLKSIMKQKWKTFRDSS